jgi:hypothetical protein
MDGASSNMLKLDYIYIYIFFVTVDVLVSLHVSRLIFWDPEVNDHVSPPVTLRFVKLELIIYKK